MKYELTEEHKALIPEHNKKWIDIILDTKRLSDKDKELCVDSVFKMYDIANLQAPKAIAFVSSPLVLAFAGGLTRYLLQGKKLPKPNINTETQSSISGIVGNTANLDVTSRLDNTTSELSPGIVTYTNFHKEVKDILEQLNMSDKYEEAMEYVKGVSSIWQGGCNWAQYDSFLSFFQDIAKLDIDYSAYQPYRNLTVAGYRIVDEEFVMISEKPISIVMKGSLAHNLEGSAIEYMDGSKLYMAHGNLIPSWIVTTPKSKITREMILNEKNADHRRYLIERIGIERYINILGDASIIDTFESKVGGKYELIQVTINDEKCNYLKMLNQSEFVYHVEGVPLEVTTCKGALAFRNGMKQYVEPKFLS